MLKIKGIDGPINPVKKRKKKNKNPAKKRKKNKNDDDDESGDEMEIETKNVKRGNKRKSKGFKSSVMKKLQNQVKNSKGKIQATKKELYEDVIKKENNNDNDEELEIKKTNVQIKTENVIIKEEKGLRLRGRKKFKTEIDNRLLTDNENDDSVVRKIKTFSNQAVLDDGVNKIVRGWNNRQANIKKELIILSNEDIEKINNRKDSNIVLFVPTQRHGVINSMAFNKNKRQTDIKINTELGIDDNVNETNESACLMEDENGMEHETSLQNYLLNNNLFETPNNSELLLDISRLIKAKSHYLNSKNSNDKIRVIPTISINHIKKVLWFKYGPFEECVSCITKSCVSTVYKELVHKSYLEYCEKFNITPSSLMSYYTPEEFDKIKKKQSQNRKFNRKTNGRLCELCYRYCVQGLYNDNIRDGTTPDEEIVLRYYKTGTPGEYAVSYTLQPYTSQNNIDVVGLLGQHVCFNLSCIKPVVGLLAENGIDVEEVLSELEYQRKIAEDNNFLEINKDRIIFGYEEVNCHHHLNNNAFLRINQINPYDYFVPANRKEITNLQIIMDYFKSLKGKDYTLIVELFEDLAEYSKRIEEEDIYLKNEFYGSGEIKSNPIISNIINEFDYSINYSILFAVFIKINGLFKLINTLLPGCLKEKIRKYLSYFTNYSLTWIVKNKAYLSNEQIFSFDMNKKFNPLSVKFIAKRESTILPHEYAYLDHKTKKISRAGPDDVILSYYKKRIENWSINSKAELGFSSSSIDKEIFSLNSKLWKLFFRNHSHDFEINEDLENIIKYENEFMELDLHFIFDDYYNDNSNRIVLNDHTNNVHNRELNQITINLYTKFLNYVLNRNVLRTWENEVNINHQIKQQLNKKNEDIYTYLNNAFLWLKESIDSNNRKYKILIEKYSIYFLNDFDETLKLLNNMKSEKIKKIYSGLLLDSARLDGILLENMLPVALEDIIDYKIYLALMLRVFALQSLYFLEPVEKYLIRQNLLLLRNSHLKLFRFMYSKEESKLKDKNFKSMPLPDNEIKKKIHDKSILTFYDLFHPHAKNEIHPGSLANYINELNYVGFFDENSKETNIWCKIFSKKPNRCCDQREYRGMLIELCRTQYGAFIDTKNQIELSLKGLFTFNTYSPKFNATVILDQFFDYSNDFNNGPNGNNEDFYKFRKNIFDFIANNLLITTATTSESLIYMLQYHPILQNLLIQNYPDFFDKKNKSNMDIIRLLFDTYHNFDKVDEIFSNTVKVQRRIYRYTSPNFIEYFSGLVKQINKRRIKNSITFLDNEILSEIELEIISRFASLVNTRNGFYITKDFQNLLGIHDNTIEALKNIICMWNNKLNVNLIENYDLICETDSNSRNRLNKNEYNPFKKVANTDTQAMNLLKDISVRQYMLLSRFFIELRSLQKIKFIKIKNMELIERQLIHLNKNYINKDPINEHNPNNQHQLDFVKENTNDDYLLEQMNEFVKKKEERDYELFDNEHVDILNLPNNPTWLFLCPSCRQVLNNFRKSSGGFSSGGKCSYDLIEDRWLCKNKVKHYSELKNNNSLIKAREETYFKFVCGESPIIIINLLNTIIQWPNKLNTTRNSLLNTKKGSRKSKTLTKTHKNYKTTNLKKKSSDTNYTGSFFNQNETQTNELFIANKNVSDNNQKNLQNSICSLVYFITPCCGYIHPYDYSAWYPSGYLCGFCSENDEIAASYKERICDVCFSVIGKKGISVSVDKTCTFLFYDDIYYFRSRICYLCFNCQKRVHNLKHNKKVVNLRYIRNAVNKPRRVFLSKKKGSTVQF